MQKASLRFALAGLVMVLGALAGCASPGDPIDRVQNNLVDKSIFEGEWWYSRAVIDVQNDALWAMGAAGVSTPWDGVHSNIDLGARAGVMGRIRWVIDENFLYAYRSYEVIQGASQEADDDGFTGEPLAIFPITAHVDVRREFNGLTGEPTNVVSESSDRRWYDRQYLRVDWSTNLVTLGLLHGMDFSSFVNFEREPVSRFTQEGGDGRDGDNYRPEFVRIGDDPDYRFRDEWPDGTEDTVHYMSFVTQEVWTPTNCPRELCSTSVEVSQRHAFLRIPPNHEYAVETLGNSEYDRFGIIRTESRTYIRGGESRNEIRRACNTDADCGGAACIDPVEEGGAEAQVPGTYCVGGLTGEYGETDFVTYYRLRHNLYRDSLTDTECRADWECDNRYGQYLPGQLPDGLGSGSTCDPAALRCTRPIAEREAREVTYHLSPNYPRHLVRTSFEVMAEWNDTFMYGHRRRLGQAAPAVPRMQCQSTDPTTYCYCDDTRDFAALEVAPDGTCEGRSNYFVPPDERGEDIPYDCWIAIVDDEGNPTTETETINPSSPQAFADYPEDVYRYAFVGSECALTLEVNSCDRPVPEGAEPAACENLGDIRYQFFNFVSGAGAGWCGVMQPNQDPLTGEAVISPVNMGGQCLDRVATNAIDLWPVLRGEADEETLFTGENVRGYFERLGNVHYPLGLSPSIEGGDFDPDPGRPAIPLDFAERAAQYIENNAERLQSLGPVVDPQTGGLNHNEASAQIFDRLDNLRDTALEYRLTEALRPEGAPISHLNELQAFAAERSYGSPSGSGFGSLDSASATAQQWADAVSPFRDGHMDSIHAAIEQERIFEQNFIMMPREELFVSRYNQWWAEAFRGRSIEEAHIRWRQDFMRNVMLHEMGHGLGMEHNFAASYDRDHYHDGYFNLVTQQDPDGSFPNALPRIDEFDADGDGSLTDDEAQAWAQGLREVRERRTEAGIGNYMTASLMDYNGDFSDSAGLGHYDRAAILYNYFNQVEAFDAAPSAVEFTQGRGTFLDGLLRSDVTPRTTFSWYRGGESCNVDIDCPSSFGSANLLPNQPFGQRCIMNPRDSNVPTACGEGMTNCICSSFDEDFLDYAAQAGPPEWYPEGTPQFEQIQYLFCSNSRTNDISWCNTFDAGESFQETIDHFRQMWTEGYPRNYFRNERSGFTTGSRALRYIVNAAKVFQHLYFRFFNEPEFREEVGPLGFLDQFQASIDSMNWLAELAQLPDVGSYRLDPVTGNYVHMGTDLDLPGSDFSLEPGEGYYTWSQYQEGLYGFFRVAQAGVFWDKLIALQALTIRNWGLSFTVDELFFVNYYDLFPIEMTELFGGYIIDDEDWFAPRVDISDPENPQVFYLNYYRGQNCRDVTTNQPEPCREANAIEFEQPSIGSTSDEIMRLYATIFALAEFPVVYDTSFETRLSIFRLEGPASFDIPDFQADGDPTRGLGAIIPGSTHLVTEDPDEADYILYQSEALNQVFGAVKQRARITYNLEEEQLGFQLLLRLTDLQDQIEVLRAIPDPTVTQVEELRQLTEDLRSGESYLETLIFLADIFGISTF